jgi:peptidoglycan/xylan/chitin deacetylase (PgdA/CDA1 family)
VSKTKPGSQVTSFGIIIHLCRSLFLGSLLLMACSPRGAAINGESRTNDAVFASQTAVRAFHLDPQPLVALSFDDADQTIYDTAFPILSLRGIPATYYFLTSFLNEQWGAQLKDLENHGWEIGSHTRTHRGLTTLSDADLIQELSQSKADLEGAGLRVTGFAYPYGAGAKDPTVIRQVKRYYAYARSVTPGNNAPLIKQYALDAQTITRSTNIDTMKSWIDLAITEKRFLIILMHTVDDTGEAYSISPAVLTELASYIKTKVDAGALKTVTVQEGVTRYSQTYWHPIDAPQSPTHSDIVISNGRVLWYLGSQVADYLNDGYEWVQNGKLRYYELNGKYRTIDLPSHVAVQTISADQVIAEFTLSSVDGEAGVVSTVTLVPGTSLAKIHITAVHGPPTRLSLAKDLARRFSVDDGLLMTDGSLETGMRTYGDSAQSFFAFDSATDLIRIMTHSQRRSHSEYSDYAKGEFRSSPISVATELPYTWFVGGTPFHTLGLLAEAETGGLDGETIFYAGVDASPRKGNTGVTMAGNGAVSIQVTPPAQGNYTLSIRHKGASNGDQYRYQIDGGEVFIRTVMATSFGYENIMLNDLSAQSHSVRVGAVSGRVDVDYVLLVPTSRSANTPAAIAFPVDVARQAYHHIFLPLIRRQDDG